MESESRDLDDVALKAKMLRDENLQELYDFTSNLAASIERDLARLSGATYEPTAEELAMARQATDWTPPEGYTDWFPTPIPAQTADDGFYENPGDSDEAQAA